MVPLIIDPSFTLSIPGRSHQPVALHNVTRILTDSGLEILNIPSGCLLLDPVTNRAKLGTTKITVKISGLSWLGIHGSVKLAESGESGDQKSLSSGHVSAAHLYLGAAETCGGRG